MRTANASMRARWQRTARGDGDRALAPALAELAESPLGRAGDALFFRQLTSGDVSPSVLEDATGFEAIANKIHVGDYATANAVDEVLIQGVLFAERLAARLRTLNRPCRVLMSLDPDSNEVTVRFFVRRMELPWGAEDVEAYEHEDVMQWDVP